MSIIGWLTGESSAASETIKTAGKMADNAFYTDQEKAENNNKLLGWYLEYQKATAPQNIARRLIALQVTALWLFLVLLGVAIKGVELFLNIEPNQDEEIFSSFIFNSITENVNTPFSIIIGFYFLSQVAERFKR